MTGDIFYLEQILCYLKPAQFHGNYWDYFRQLRNLITTEKKKMYIMDLLSILFNKAAVLLNVFALPGPMLRVCDTVTDSCSRAGWLSCHSAGTSCSEAKQLLRSPRAELRANASGVTAGAPGAAPATRSRGVLAPALGLTQPWRCREE